MLTEHIKQIQEKLRRGEYQSEAAVSQGVVLPALHELGWPVFDTTIVAPEFSLEGRRVDFALCHPAERPAVFIEVKKVGYTDGADQQLFEYAFHLGIPMAILTDGQEWNFYLPGEQGRYDERRVYKLDLLERSLDESAERLKRYLDFHRVCSGDALKAARSDYQNVARNREIHATLPKAWVNLLTEPDSLLIDLLAEKTEDLCGYKPDPDTCSQFLSSIDQRKMPEPSTRVLGRKRRNSTSHSFSPAPARETRRRRPYSFELKGRSYGASSAKDMTVRVFQLLERNDPEFFDKFSSRKHGRKRRYLARDKFELYPGRPDLCEQCSIEIAPGWWLGTNYGTREFQKMLDLALEVTSPSLRGSIKINL